MTQNRTDLNFEKNNSTYIILTVILVILSLLGVYLFFQIQKKPEVAVIDSFPTDIPSPTSKLIETEEPTSIPSPTSKLSPTTKPTLVPSVVTPTPPTQNFSSSVDNFSVIYKSDRKVYQDKESTGNRYTFYSSIGNIAVHVGTQWSWVYPNRQFTTTSTVAGKSTFVYDINSQKIIDFENGDKKYTIQCVHNGSATVLTDCVQFVNDFKLL